ncbi:MAG: DUF5668 domain-containing protein [Bacteroidota bacterium]
MESKFKFSPQFVLGVLVIFVGVMFTLDNLDVVDARDYFRYWPVLLIIYGFFKMTGSEAVPARVWGLVITMIGAVFLLEKLYIIDFRVWDLWPIFLIMLGASMMWRTVNRNQARGGVFSATVDKTYMDSDIRDFVMMGGLTRSNTSADFRGGEATAIMGGVELDLTGATIKGKEAVLEIFAFWGGIDLRVPESWTVSVQAMPIMGGVEDNTRRPKEEDRRLIIKGYAIMGGVEISNKPFRK